MKEEALFFSINAITNFNLFTAVNRRENILNQAQSLARNKKE